MRLLTEEEIKGFKVEASRQANDLQNTTEGHFKEEDIDAIYLEADKAMLEAQRKETLKEVGEWLDKRFPNISLTELAGFIDCLKDGEMPEEGK